jgi:succinate dehydrogenase hydrophobic anchor subunit
MTLQARIGLATTVLSFIGGVWLFLAPFIVGYQEVGEDWIRATRNDLWTGGILMAISVLTFFLFVAFALRDVAARADERRRSEEDSQSEDSQSRQQ